MRELFVLPCYASCGGLRLLETLWMNFGVVLDSRAPAQSSPHAYLEVLVWSSVMLLSEIMAVEKLPCECGIISTWRVR